MVHFLVAQGYPWLTRRIPSIATSEQTRLHLAYTIGTSVLTRILERATAQGFQVVQVRVDRSDEKAPQDTELRHDEAGTAFVHMDVEGTGSVHQLVAELSEFEGVLSVSSVKGELAE